MFNWEQFVAKLEETGDFEPSSYNLPDLSIGIDLKTLDEVNAAFEIARERFDANSTPDPTSDTCKKTRTELAKMTHGLSCHPIISVFTDCDLSKAAGLMYIKGRHSFALPGTRIDFDGVPLQYQGLLASGRKAEHFKGAMAVGVFYDTNSSPDSMGRRKMEYVIYASQLGYHNALTNLEFVGAEFTREKKQSGVVTQLTSPSILLQIAFAEVERESKLKGRMPLEIQSLDVSGKSIQITTIAIDEEETLMGGTFITPTSRFLNEHVIDFRFSEFNIVGAKHVSYFERPYTLN